MNGFGPPEGDDDCCGCTFGKSCDFHAEQARRSREAWEAQCEAEGTNPDADVSDPELVSVVVAIELSHALSENQKRAIRRIIFPRRTV